MPIYQKPSGNDANSGTSFGDAVQTISKAVSLLDPNTASRRDVLLCADTPGGTANLGGSLNRFSNINQSIFPYGTSWANGLSISGNVGDTIVITAPGHQFHFKDRMKFLDVFNITFDGINFGSTEAKMVDVFAQAVFDLHDFKFRECTLKRSGSSNLFFDQYCHDYLLENCTSFDAGRLNNQVNLWYTQGWNVTLRGNYGYYSSTPPSLAGGLRCYTNSTSVNETTALHTENVVFEKNFVKNARYNYMAQGENIVFKNNISKDAWLFHYELLYNVANVGDDMRVINNAASGQSASGSHGIYLTSSSITNLVDTNNIYYGMTNAQTYNGATPLEALTNLTTDPSWIDAPNDDFHIPTGSSAKNAGTTKAEVTDDYYGLSRPQGAGYCIGPAEFEESVVAGISRDRIVNVGLLNSPRRYFFVGGR